MQRPAFLTKAISLTLNACLVLSPVLWARDVSRAAGPEPEKVEWSSQFDFMAMRAYGYEPELLEAIKAYVPASDNEPPPDISSGGTLDDELDTWGFAFRGEVQAMKNRWGAGVKGFQFDTRSTFERSESAAAALSNPFAAAGPGELFASGYRSAAATSLFVGETEFGGPSSPQALLVGNDIEDPDGLLINSMDLGDGSYRQEFEARNELDVWSTDFYGFWRAVDHEKGNLDVRLGAKIGSLDVGMDSTHRILPCDTGCHASMDLDTSVKSSVLGGPYLAAAGAARWGKVRVAAELAQSVLFGDVDYRTRATAFNNVFGDPDGPGVKYTRNLVNRSKSVTVPVTEASLKLIYDAHENLSFGVGAYTGVWWNASVPATTKPNSVQVKETDEAPLSFRRASGTDTGVDEENLIFLGILATVEIRFFGP